MNPPIKTEEIKKEVLTQNQTLVQVALRQLRDSKEKHFDYQVALLKVSILVS